LEPLFPGQSQAALLRPEKDVLWSGAALNLRQDYRFLSLWISAQSWAPDKLSGWGTMPGVPLFRFTTELRAQKAVYHERAVVALLVGGDLLGRRNFPGASLPDQSVAYCGASARIRTLYLHFYVDDFLAQNWQGAPGYYIQGPRISYGLTWNFID
jgi:hypothetical protein